MSAFEPQSPAPTPSFEPYSEQPSPTPTGGAGAHAEGSAAARSDPAISAETGAGPGVPGVLGGTEGDDAESAKDRAADSAQAGKDAAGEVAQTAADKAQDVAAEAKTQAKDLLGQAQSQLQEQAGVQHRNLVTNLRSLGEELGSMADRSEHGGPATDLVAQAGGRARDAASWIESRDPGELLEEVRAFARRKPGTFVLGALAAGLVAGRLTRGVVDVHRDDTDASDIATGSATETAADGQHRSDLA